MNRRAFLASSLTALAPAQPLSLPKSLGVHIKRPLAITMWDFSWLERRWPGAGYEDPGLALDELKARGYDAVRIDAYPHLIEAGPDKTWELLPQWNQQDWGAPARCRVQVQPALNQFIRACAERGLSVGLSTWFRQDTGDTRMAIRTPRHLGMAWKAALDSIASAGLLKHILYVDLCNEFPLDVWAPFAPKGLLRAAPEGVRWMAEPIELLRETYPQLAYTFSFTSEYETWKQQDVSMLDFLELHLWMTHFTDFYKQVGYNYERFDSKGYENLALKGEKLYRERPPFWNQKLREGVLWAADWSRASGKPLITTECWSVVDYKDWPLLTWDWIKDLCETGVTTAASTGRWAAIGTSNFCGPQFRGMWRDDAWHRRLTGVIHSARLS